MEQTEGLTRSGSGPSACEGQVHEGADGKADEPGIVVERTHGGEDQSTPGDRTAGERRDDSGGVPAPVAAIREIQVLERQLPPAQDPVIRNQHTRNRPEAARISNQPVEDVPAWVREETPGLNQKPEQTGDQPAGAEPDQLRKRVGEVVGRRNDVCGDVDRQRATTAVNIEMAITSG